MRVIPIVAASLVVAACGTDEPPSSQVAAEAGSGDGTRAEVEHALDAALASLSILADSIDALLQPVPLLTPAEENALRRYGNDVQLSRARSLGARPVDAAEMQAMRTDGRLIELEDSTDLWAVRRLEHSLPLVTPDAHALLTRIAQMFQERLAGMGLPRYRVEVTSVLRTAESQADLRQSNPNAAAGASTHEYGTTLDLAYSSFAAPLAPDLDLDVSAVPWLEPRIDLVASAMLETAAARKSRELQAILGQVLLQLQQGGDVFVTLERQQPVYHLTVARRLGSGD